MRRLAIAWLLLLAPFDTAAATTAQIFSSLRAAAAGSGEQAAAALEELIGLAAIEAAGELGLVTKAERDAARLGPAIPVLMVRLDALQQFEPESDADILDLLIPSGRVFYPVLVPGDDPARPFVIRSGLEVFNAPGAGWDTAILGGTNFTSAVAGTLDAVRRSADETVMVQVPSFRLTFVAFTENETLMLASISDAPEFDIVAQAKRDARTLLRELLPWARQHSGGPV